MKVNYQKSLNNGLFKDLLKIFIIFLVIQRMLKKVGITLKYMKMIFNKSYKDQDLEKVKIYGMTLQMVPLYFPEIC